MVQPELAVAHSEDVRDSSPSSAGSEGGSELVVLVVAGSEHDQNINPGFIVLQLEKRGVDVPVLVVVVHGEHDPS